MRKQNLVAIFVVGSLISGCVGSCPTSTSGRIDFDLTKVQHVAPKGRMQDKEYNRGPRIIDCVIAKGPRSIPVLIEKLDDETVIDHPVKDFWVDLRVGDVAFFMLTNLFTDSSFEHSTIPGASWDEFFGVDESSDKSAQMVYYEFLQKHGRDGLKDRWMKIWEENRERIYWDKKERCFRKRAS